MATVFVTITVL